MSFENVQPTEASFKAEYTPQGIDEWGATARALRNHRKYETARRVVETLTRREQLLIEAASEAGRASVLDEVAKVIGTAALTVDPKVVLEAARRGRTIEADPRYYHPLPPAADLLDVVARVQRTLDHESQTESQTESMR